MTIKERFRRNKIEKYMKYTPKYLEKNSNQNINHKTIVKNNEAINVLKSLDHQLNENRYALIDIYHNKSLSFKQKELISKTINQCEQLQKDIERILAKNELTIGALFIKVYIYVIGIGTLMKFLLTNTVFSNFDVTNKQSPSLSVVNRSISSLAIFSNPKISILVVMGLILRLYTNHLTKKLYTEKERYSQKEIFDEIKFIYDKENKIKTYMKSFN